MHSRSIMAKVQIQEEYPLHWLVWNNDYEELLEALVEQKVIKREPIIPHPLIID